MAEKMPLADVAIRFLSDRKGFDGWWDGIDEDVQQELREALQVELTVHLTQPAQAVDVERVAQLIAHRACCGTEADPLNGKLHGYCVVCGVPWPCEYAGTPPTRAIGNAQAEGWKVPDAMECPPLNLSLPVSGEYHEGYCYGWNACRAAILPTPPQPEE